MSEHKRALIFVNGQHFNLPYLAAWMQPDDDLIAADAGLRFVRQLGREPRLLIGDLDSLAEAEVESARQHGVTIRQYPVHKDETDLELALLAALAEGFTEIRIVAALGGRLDMTLGNLFLLMLPALRGLDVRLEDGFDEVFLIYPGESGAQIDGKPGEIISLLPLNGPAAGIRTSNLYYPLAGETLYPERTRGISNVMTSATAQVSLESGLLLCIHTHA